VLKTINSYNSNNSLTSARGLENKSSAISRMPTQNTHKNVTCNLDFV